MSGSSVTSPLCTWIVAACMSLPNEKKTHSQSSSMFLSLKPKRKVFAKFSTNGGFVSSICGSGFQSLVSSFEPCDEFYSKGAFFADIGFSSIFGSKNVSLGRRERRINRASRTGKFFGDIGFSSIFGSKNVSLSRRERMINRAARSGKIMAVAVETVKEGETRKKSVTKKRRVVVTGLGVVTPLGIDADIFYNNLLDGKSGISEIEAFDCAQFPTKIAGEIKGFSTEGWVAPKLSKRADKFMLYLLTAGKKALADGGITKDSMEELDKFKCGIVIGSALGGMKVFNDGIEALRVSYKKMNPFCVPFATANMGSAMLAMDLGWMGPNYSVSAACATSNFCILNAANHIIRGETDMMLCGGSDAAIIPIGLGGFVACRALSEMYTDPTKASRPFDTTRDGFVMGEGAGVLLLEDLEHAKKRGARIYAEFLGGSFTADAYHMTEPHPDGTGVSLCIENALAQSGVAREDVNYINAHAASTQTGDLNEYLAITRCFGENPVLRVNSTKSMTGHLLGAAGAVEAVATIKAIQTGWLHPNINLESPDKGMDMNVLVGDKKEKLDIKVALSNSFGFGGHNSSILFAPYKED